MAPKTVSVTVRYSKPGTQPPIYLGGSFDDPQWHEPREMQYTTDENNEHDFYTEVNVEEGKEYQYKFRVGPGDWWVLNEASPTVPDNQGIPNNLLAVPISEHSTAIVESTPAADALTAEEPPALAADMEHSTRGHAEEAMDTRETSDVLFDDEIVKDLEQPEATPSSVVRDPVEPHSTSAAESKADVVEAMKDGKIAPLDSSPGTVEPHPTPASEPKTVVGDKSKDTKKASLAVSPEPLEPHPTPAMELDKVDAELVEEPEDGNGRDNDKATRSTDSIESAPTSPSAIILTEDQPNAPTSEAEESHIDVTEHGNASGNSGPEPHSTAPALVVEKVDSKPSFGDDFGPGATVAEKDAHKLRTLDAEPDLTIIRNGAKTPEIANVAAEVADSAATLDRDAPTPPISDEEAGRTGYRRMSNTPIPEVAATAAEVADIAAYIDGVPISKKEFGDLLETRGYFEIMNDESIQFAETPPDEKVPQLPHESGLSLPIRNSTAVYDPVDIPFYDPNESTMIPFPEDREGILRELARIEASMPQGARAYSERSSSLGLIAEEIEEDQEDLSGPVKVNGSGGLTHSSKTEPEGMMGDSDKVGDGIAVSNPAISNGENVKPEEGETPTVEVPVTSSPEPVDLNASVDGAEESPRMPLPATPERIPATPFVVGNRQLGHDDGEVQAITTTGGPNILVEPATPAASTALPNPMDQPVDNQPLAQPAKPVEQPIDTAKTSAIEDKNGSGKLISRKQPPSPVPERPITPSSLRSVNKDAGSRNFLKAFWRVVFVDWIGGLIVRLCGGNRRKLLAVGAIAAFGLYFFLPTPRVVGLGMGVP
ncbi:uncharacterized protein L3040_006732 [Drepanopeziza brunnea f. sp. 'multigermtubi']|uniref:uncharacterized protein n=1 Tax=Drepanopeziza brunnea f. sp. 'multigermtubi' TaxID=698441 RepID=UPI002397F478|nr:hypothetical protein L3040_006732 [Drepanopeziza brunnea f. sp. 'multigermtubi']